MSKKEFTEAATKVAIKTPAEVIMDTLQPAKDLPAEGHETKSRKVSALVKPSVWDDAQTIVMLKKQAGDRKASLNDVINTALESFIAENRDLLEAYREAMKSVQI